MPADGTGKGRGLEGLRVIEIGGGVAAATAGKVLADLGAEVIKIEPPDGDALRSQGPFRPGNPSPGSREETGGMHLHLNANKRSVTADLRATEGGAVLVDLATRAELLIHDCAPGEMASVGLSYEQLSAFNPGLVMLSITPFGLSGPHRDFAASDLTVLHAGGWGYLIPGRGSPREWPPLRPFGNHALSQGGLHAAVVALAAVLDARDGAHGDHIDFSMQQNIAFLLGRHFAAYTYAGEVDHRSKASLYEPMSFYPCRDGSIFIICPEPAQWERMLEVMGNPAWATKGDYISREGRMEHADEIRERVAQWTQGFDVEPLFHALQNVRVGAAPVYEHARLPGQEQLRARAFFHQLAHPEAGPVEYLGPPYRLSPPAWRLARPAPGLGEANTAREILLAPRAGGEDADDHADRESGQGSSLPTRSAKLPLEGVRVLDLSWVWAGPHCTMLLGALGAEVIKVESSKRLDLTRRASVFDPELGGGPNKSGYFNQINQYKRSVGVDLSHPQGKNIIKRLAAVSDVMVSNFGTGVLERLGLGPEVMHEINPSLTLAMVSAFGQDGPWARYTGYGPLISPLGGLSVVTGYREDGKPRDVNMAYGDPNGGVYAALGALASVFARRNHGTAKQIVDVSMWEAMLCTGFEGWMNHALGEQPYGLMDNHDPVFAPHNVYQCLEEDSWVSIAVTNERQWTGLLAVIPELAQASFSTMTSRKTNERALDDALSQWCAARDRWEITGLLQKHQVPAFPVMHSKDLVEDAHLAARDAFNRFDHPEVGRKTHVGPPWQWTQRGNDHGSAAPCLGEHTDSVMRECLGMADDELATLRAQGVLE